MLLVIKVMYLWRTICKPFKPKLYDYKITHRAFICAIHVD